MIFGPGYAKVNNFWSKPIEKMMFLKASVNRPMNLNSDGEFLNACD